MLFVHIIQLSELAYSQVFKALRFQPVLAETLLPHSFLQRSLLLSYLTIVRPSLSYPKETTCKIFKIVRHFTI